MAQSQVAIVKEMDVRIPTYGFSDPDPIPMLATQPELYPYNKFSTYAYTAIDKEWRVVILENDYLIVEILPGVGGKIWGITEKKTGYDIIYKNETLKFRNIATRGPWSSGGIEFNFGFFGHTPYAATPVSYFTEMTSDGSAVCILGATDLPSRSDWRVKIILPADKAYVKIEYAWINNNAYSHPYYYWTNAAVRATEDLRFDYPGVMQIGHGGEAYPYPLDESGRDLSYYRNNAFGGNKSYHVLGDNKPYKAVYWQDKGIGVGSLADKWNILGKKIWIWSMAPAGAIWEDMLTDKNGQYIEIQSGRLYNQASPESGICTPYTQYDFQPYQCDYWNEYWYPVIGTGGVSDASKEAVLYVDEDTGEVVVRVMALERLNTELVVRSKEGIIYQNRVELEPAQTAEYRVPFKPEDITEISVSGTGLNYSVTDPYSVTQRPIVRRENAEDVYSRKLAVAEENFKYRRFKLAEENYNSYLEAFPNSIPVLNRLAEICLRTNREDEAHGYITRVLERDTYDGDANFLLGLYAVGKKDYNTAEESFAVASRSRQWRVPAMIEMTRIFLLNGRYRQAIEKGEEALLYDARNINALRLLALGYKATSRQQEYQEMLEKVRAIDQLDYFVCMEEWMRSRSFEAKELPGSILHNEFPEEIIMEFALFYYSTGFGDEAFKLMNCCVNTPMAYYWLAYLDRDNTDLYLQKAENLDIRYNFPYRKETYPVLEYVASLSPSWKIRYYQALFRWMWGDVEESNALFALCGNPSSSTFYLIRGSFYGKHSERKKAVADFRRHLSMDRSDWRIYYYLPCSLSGQEEIAEALKIAKEGKDRFRDQFMLQYNYANLLIINKNYEEALSILKKIKVLPAEHTGSAYPLYFAATILRALDKMGTESYKEAMAYISASKQWPANLGGGFGYETDFTFQDLLSAYCLGSFTKTALDTFISRMEVNGELSSLMRIWIKAYREDDQLRMWSCLELAEKQLVDSYTLTNDYVYIKAFQIILN